MLSNKLKYLALLSLLSFSFYFFVTRIGAKSATPSSSGDNEIKTTETPNPAVPNTVSAIENNPVVTPPEPASAVPPAITPAANEVSRAGSGTPTDTTADALQDKPTVKRKEPRPVPDSDVQIIKSTYTNYDDIQPSSFTVKAGRPVRFEVYPKETDYGCMSTIIIPGLYETPQLIEANKPIIMEFTPKDIGEYEITCVMGVPRGTIKVIK
jgi:hypothetical protein